MFLGPMGREGGFGDGLFPGAAAKSAAAPGVARCKTCGDRDPKLWLFRAPKQLWELLSVLEGGFGWRELLRHPLSWAAYIELF